MKKNVDATISFLLKIYPNLYNNFYLELLKQFSNNKNINKTQIRALCHIYTNGPISMTNLCNKLVIEKGSLTSMIDDLTNKSYVVRKRDDKDRRKYILTLTEKGEKISDEFFKFLAVNLEVELEKLEKEDIEELVNSMSVIAKIMEKHAKIMNGK